MMRRMLMPDVRKLSTVIKPSNVDHGDGTAVVP